MKNAPPPPAPPIPKTPPLGHPVRDRQLITSLAFDQHGRQRSRTLALSQMEMRFYDDRSLSDLAAGARASSAALGQLALSVDFEGNITEYLYDNTATGGGRPVETRYHKPDAGFIPALNMTAAEVRAALAGQTPAQAVAYTYDAFGRTLSTSQDYPASSNRSDRSVTHTYDAEGRLTEAATPEGTISYAYDALGRPTATWTDGGTRTEYSYDLLGRLMTIKSVERFGVDLSATPDGPDTTTYEYDLVGNLDEVLQSNGVVADYRYDALNRLEMLTHYAPEDGTGDPATFLDNEVLANYEYQLNLDGSRAKVVETNDLGKETAITWTYDGLNRLIKEEYDHGNDGPTSEDYETTYVYDLVGNRLSKATDNYDDGNLDGVADVEITYDYDANDRLLSETKDDLNDDTQDRHTVYAYGPTVKTGKTIHQGLDDSGAIVSEKIYQYDARGRLAKLTIDSNGDGIGDSTIAYAYNDRGIRVSMTTDGQTVTYLIDASNPTGYAQTIEERDAAGNVTKTYTIGLDVIAQAAAQALSANGVNVDAKQLLALLYDGHGSTRALLDEAAQVVQRFAYDAYGNQLSGVGLTGASAAFTTLLHSGEHFDPKARMQYLRARWYDPATGRFTRMDPFSGLMSEPQSLHKYLFTHGDPVNLDDPSGRFALAASAVVALAFPSILGVLVAQVGAYIAVDKMIFDPLRFNSLLVHVRDATLLRIAQAFNVGALRAPSSPPIFFSPVSIPVFDAIGSLNNFLFQGVRAGAIKSGAADASTRAAIYAFLASLGLSPTAVMTINPALVRPSRDVAIIRTASRTSPLASRFGGGISVRWDAGFLSRILIKSVITQPWEMVPASKYKYTII